MRSGSRALRAAFEVIHIARAVWLRGGRAMWPRGAGAVWLREGGGFKKEAERRRSPRREHHAFATWSTHVTSGCTLVHAGTMLRSEEHTSELQSRGHLVCRLLLEKKRL